MCLRARSRFDKETLAPVRLTAAAARAITIRTNMCLRDVLPYYDIKITAQYKHIRLQHTAMVGIEQLRQDAL